MCACPSAMHLPITCNALPVLCGNFPLFYYQGVPGEEEVKALCGSTQEECVYALIVCPPAQWEPTPGDRARHTWRSGHDFSVAVSVGHETLSDSLQYI